MTIPPARTKEQSANLIARLDALTSSSNTSQIVAIKEYQMHHEAHIRKNYGRFIDQFEMFFCAMVDYSHNINYLDKKAWPTNRGFQFVIMTSSLKQFYSAYTLLLNGAYEDAITILRSIYESFLRIIFVSCHPECPYNAYSAKGQTGTKFNATGLVTDELGLGWTTYSTTSAFAHSNMYKVMGDMIEISTGKPKLIAFTYELDDDMISLITNFINFLLTILLDAYDQLFIVDISKHQSRHEIQAHIDKLHEYALICHEALRTHNANEYWRETAVDIENIFELIKTMDSDSSLNWKQTWKHITNKPGDIQS